jgi:Protein of unknown function (DUF3300)
MQGLKQILSVCLSITLTLSVIDLDGCAKKSDQGPATQGQTPASQAPATTYATPTPDQLYQLVAPIALFPDNLLAQVLAGSTYPDQVTAAYNWMKQNANLKGQQLMETVNQQPWDNSIKGLTQFPDVLGQLATNLSWTSALGDAYFNVPQDVMNAVQVMRQRAYQAGNLKSNQQQNVSVENQAPGSAAAPAASGEAQTTVVQPPPQTIVIQPSQPEVVYVPTYNPTVVYGAPVATYPGYSTDALVATGLISFGLGIAVGAAISNNGCCGWGYNSWGCGWNNSSVTYNRNTYISTSNTFVNRNNYYRNANYNNINRNNINTNDINRNNINRNNINTNNINTNDINRNNRANNFDNTARNNGSTPNFGQKYNQPQFQNNQAGAAQNNRQQSGAGNQARVNQPGANQGRLNQQQGAGQGRVNQQPAGANQNRGGGNLSQPQRDAARGYGQQPNRGTSSSALSNYSPGGNTRTNSARGQQSLQGNRNAGGGGGARPAQASRQAPASRPAPRAGGNHR